MKRVDQWRTEVLSGHIAMEDAPTSVQSWLRHDIFLGAEEILKLPRNDRKAALDRIPEKVRPYVEAEVRRVYQLNRDLHRLP